MAIIWNSGLFVIGPYVVSFNGRGGAVVLLLSDVISALGFTPENSANKAIDFTTVNNVKYPTVKAVVDYIATLPPGGVSSFNTRTGAVTLLGADVLAAVSSTGTGTVFVLSNTPSLSTATLLGVTTAGYINYIVSGSHITPAQGFNLYDYLNLFWFTDSSGKGVGFDTTLITANAKREYQWPDKNGIVAMLSDIPATGVTSFNARTGAVVLLSADVLAALGYTPAANNQTMFIGTTSVAINRASGTLNLAGIGSLGTTGALTVANNTATIGLTTGNTNLSLNGGNATNGGSKLSFVNNGVATFYIGNYSSIVGGAYNALPTIYLPGGVLALVGALLVNTITPLTGATGVDVLGSIGSSTLTPSQLVIADSNKVMTGLAAGTNGQVLSVVGGVPAWQSIYYSTSATPTVAIGSGAGTGATVSITGTNQDGEITLNTGTGPAVGTLFTVTMSGGFAYPNKCTPVVQEVTGNTTSGNVFIATGLATAFVIAVGVLPLNASGVYRLYYHNGGY